MKTITEKNYKILVDRIGKEKADQVVKNFEDHMIKTKEENEMQDQREKKFLEIAIQKDQLEDHEYYQGFRFRGHGIAQWDAKIGKFLILAYNFDQPYVERLEHFADTIEKHFDGFVPLEKIDKNKFYGIRDKRLDPDKIEEEVKRLKK
jgi:hypothetical protein